MRRHGKTTLRRLATGIAAGVAAATVAAPAQASNPRAEITSPARGATVTGTVPWRTRVAGRPTSVRFLVDGVPLPLAHPSRAAGRPGAGGELDTAVLSNGRHRLTVVARYRRHAVRTTITVRVLNPAPAADAHAGSGAHGGGDGAAAGASTGSPSASTPSRGSGNGSTGTGSGSGGTATGSNGSSVQGGGPGVLPPPPPPGPSSPPPAGAPLWSDGFESGNFNGWSWWGQGDSSWGHIAVVPGGSGGVPAAPHGTNVARFETTPDDVAAGRINAKLFEGFYTGGPSVLSRHSPADVSGTYRVQYYFPTTYRVPHGTSVNAFQFKERFRTAEGDAPSNPLWWIQLADASWAHSMGGPAVDRADAPVAFLSYQTNNFSRQMHYMPVPLGRWIEFRAELHQHDRIDFYIDGRWLDTGRASEYPVNPFHGSASLEWTFGIGNYSGGANGPLYADDASYTPGP